MTPCSLQLFSRAVLYNRMKLMLVGVQGIGKTSLLNQLRKEDKAGNVKNKVPTDIYSGFPLALENREKSEKFFQAGNFKNLPQSQGKDTEYSLHYHVTVEK